jgi:hypothetical protein
MALTRKHWKRGLLIVGVLILIVILTAAYLGQRWNKQIRIQLRTYVQEMSDSLYILKYADLQLNPLTGSLTLEKVSLVRDSAVYEKLKAEHRAPQFLYTVAADQVQLRYFKVWRYFQRKELSAGALVLQNPSVVLELNRQNIDTTRPRNAYQNISKRIHSISIGTLLLDNTNVKYTIIKKDSSLVMTQLQELRIHVNNFLIDSLALNDPSRFLYARNYEFDLKEYRYRTPDSLYWMHVRDVHYDAEEENLTVGQFRVEPRYNRAEFDKKAIYQRDRFDVTLNDITLSHLQPRLLLEDQIFWARKLNIASASLDIYHNRNLPSAPGNKLGGYPNQMLLKLPLPLFIDTLSGHRTELVYTEINPKTQEGGRLSFKGVNGTFTNITNIDSLIKRNSHMVADLDAIFMNSGQLKARFDFSLLDNSGQFGLTGQLRNMDGRELNPVLKPLAVVEVKSCHINDLSFNMKGNEKGASATLTFLYSDLKATILKKEEGTDDYKKKGLLSFLANAILIKDNNPSNGETRVAHPQFTRDPQRSFFNLVWKTIFVGIKETALGKNSPI